MIANMMDEKLFGNAAAYVRVEEIQKQGLFHACFAFFLNQAPNIRFNHADKLD